MLALIAVFVVLNAPASGNDRSRTRVKVAAEIIEIVSRLRSKIPQDLNRSRRYETPSELQYTQPFLRIDGCSFEYHLDQYSFAVIRFDLRKYQLFLPPRIDEGNDAWPPRATYGFLQAPESLPDHWQSSHLRQLAEREVEARLKASGDPDWHRNARKEIAPRALRGEFGEHILANHYRSEDRGQVIWVSSVGAVWLKTRAEDKVRFLYLLGEYILRFCAR